ncbi:putative late blight resistance protein homolog R1A-10 isoform X1 [Olea europaea var. sylvestris]|uniref:putative late blight resistance protein homolog R1A-10 isoform X1 n=1 Tax=Olea europaea var. sylvestris TaxID=158386 RepID=UPI000C1CF5E5|nr:putative late blight resistance protein homolog R1A-10 isoform X1 [Olea europaea var. sylvestris]XP_022895507.1 putative late blight resistance protein homolog R1A-10 isoform X1 [Olea europaea var. sylvestris]XP_022895508.1 putative late blight resistance protein homolog R1A-10 isoform X1 [Olea europaea var. sylvestris]XP_022895509.1 putative late blight resistance protein homolog R1A-10 isoform X1 [Olea europaea var. sylvestris]XP_022895510.1 putative late blight resistance protein homolog 
MNTAYLEFLVDKFVRDVQAAEQISSELPLFSKFKEIMSILQEKKIVPEKLIEIKGELQKINDLLVEVEDRRGKQKFHPTRTGKDLWNLYKTGRRLSTIRDKLKRVYGKPVNEEERQPKKAEVLVIEKKDLPGIYLPKYRGFDDQMVEIENLLSKNKGNVAIGRVGIYGSGKSALARKVIFSSNVEKLFELVLWIDLSEVIGSEETYECIKMGKTSYGNESSSGNDLHALLSSHLSPAKKCLVVLDGVSVALDGLKRVIGEILDNGSVIVTSTLPEVHKTLVPAKQKFHLHRLRAYKERIVGLFSRT